MGDEYKYLELLQEQSIATRQNKTQKIVLDVLISIR
jgi:hypothetical protein